MHDVDIRAITCQISSVQTISFVHRPQICNISSRPFISGQICTRGQIKALRGQKHLL